MKRQDIVDAWVYADRRFFDEYCNCDIMTTKKVYSSLNGHCFIPEIRKVIYNPPATIILWEDETKTVVKCCETDIYDPEKGFAMAVIKKLCGNESAPFHRLFKTWVPDESAPAININVDLRRGVNDMFNRIFGIGGTYGN